ncbi:probable G-protein coupled receptor Mth-like 1 [Palaemon carinicauda]|uniref:probable G-protein coupled receptor Mth-like 1 n=1 Tax=Palaemon carinicauda TaxID=392227 RepID=UPI0035B60A1B
MLNKGVNARKLVALAMFMQTFVSPIRSASEDQLSLSASTFKPENLTTEKANAYDFTTTTEVSTTTTEVSTTTTSDPRIDDSFSDVGGIEESISSEDGDTARNNTFELQTFVSTTPSGDVDDNASTERPSGEPGTVCPAPVGGKTKRGTIVKCQCQGMEVLVDGECQPHEGVVIPVAYNKYYSKLEDVKNYMVKTENMNCDPTYYLTRNFSRGQFHLRLDKGDVVLLKDAGQLEEQRISKYCVTHHLDNQHYLTWTLRACIPIPSVPRCCAFGKAMKDGECQTARTPSVLKPPVISKPHSKKPVEWTNIQNYHLNLKCQSDPMVTVPLGNNGTHLLLLANGLSLTWKPNEVGPYDRTYFCPDYCTDGIEESDGTVHYFVSFCYMSRKERHDKACGDGPCMRRCCDDGSSYNSSKRKCSPDSNSTFSPLDVANSSSYTIVTGLPVCDFLTMYDKKISIDSEGQLSTEYRNYSSFEYCVDVNIQEAHRTASVYFCGVEPLSWKSVRIPVILTCTVISLFFLTLCIICYQLVPKLRANGGTHQLCHVLSLFIAYSMSFTVNCFNNDLVHHFASCFSLAIFMQFGFLTAFFWLNIMCFEVWRKIRKLTKYQTSKKYPEIYFMLYGWGVPLCISAVTVMMQFVNPHEVRGEIRPYIAIKKCWFQEHIGVLLYFYCPIAVLSLCNALLLILTFIDAKIILRNSREASRELNTIGRSSRDMVDCVKDFHQKLKLFAISVFCWATEFLSFIIPPEEIWAPTDILNALQGLFIFIIMMTNSNKRKLIEKRFPLPFRLARRCSAALSCFRKAAAERRDENAASSEPESSKSDSVSMETTTSTLTLSCFSSVNNVQDGGDSCKV